jgi:hypothetical protein
MPGGWKMARDFHGWAEATSALSGRSLRDRVEKALRLALKAGYNAGRQRELAELMKGARGIVDSGVPDLASNPRHLAGFRRDRSPH